MRTNYFRPFLVVMVAIVLGISACAPATGGDANQTAQSTATPVTATAVATTDATTSIASTATTAPIATTATSTLACSAGATSATLTPELTEGPYFKAGSPERASLLEDGMAGTKLVITGYVFTADCKPVANAELDFWQADANGQYDNSGYTLRGHQFTDSNGRFQLTTVVPGLYPGRTEHIHFKVQAPNGPILTSQLFFPGVTQNAEDGIYNAALLLSIDKQSANEMQASYNFVVTP
jgi:protocatechuate 3,4-dioxygenase beta subunit